MQAKQEKNAGEREEQKEVVNKGIFKFEIAESYQTIE